MGFNTSWVFKIYLRIKSKWSQPCCGGGWRLNFSTWALTNCGWGPSPSRWVRPGYGWAARFQVPHQQGQTL